LLARQPEVLSRRRREKNESLIFIQITLDPTRFQGG
jgi:hypothetical protein